MKLGILSDSHGHADRVKAALHIFDRLEVDRIIHCGDVGGMEVFDELAGRSCCFVWGNTDVPNQAIHAYLSTVGLKPPEQVPLRVELAGKIIEVFHGHEPDFRRAIVAPRVDYIFHGHTHVPHDERIAGCRIINPGALHRVRTYTVATLDLAQDVVEFHSLPATD